ncbi:protein inturned-like [Tachysurus vachellii]|uniref:protein inturned-like n=1 Tax=Tachysurus vachellii TaxID=175792 RepID=UPI00296B398C|nr:protein inturned-like [Tachysurus vachellii]
MYKVAELRSEFIKDCKSSQRELLSVISLQGYLIANRLPKEDLLDVCLYCQHYCLLCLGAEQRVGQLVVWREVFLQHRSQPDSGTSSSHSGYCESNGRVFLLVVGLKHLMQCVLLEDGGCASPALGSSGPDCFYVHQVKATLLQLECLESPIDEHLSAPPTPFLSCADWFLPSSGRDMIGSSQILSRLTAAIKLPSPGTIGRSHRDSLGSGRSDGNGGQFKIPKLKQHNPFCLGSLMKSLTEREAEDMQNTLKGVCVEKDQTVQGIFITPTHRELSLLGGSIHPQLIRNFYHCCLSIRHIFQQSLPVCVCFSV